MAFIGVYGGLLCAILGWYFGRRQAKKNNGLDEMYYFVMGKSQSIAWFATLAALYVFMSLELFDMSIGMMPTLAILLFIHLGTWAIATFILFKKMTDDAFVPNKMIKAATIIICIVIAIFFTILSLVTGNWKFAIGAISPIVINLLFLIDKRDNK